MKKKTVGLLGVFAISGSMLAGCGGAASNTGNTGDAKDEVIVTMPTTSEPESGFDPAYGWGAGEHIHLWSFIISIIHWIPHLLRWLNIHHTRTKP